MPTRSLPALRPCLLLALSSLALGCQQEPTLPPPADLAADSHATPLALASEQSLGVWRLHLDPHTLLADLSMDRQATAGQQSYLLALDGVLQPATIQLERVARAGTDIALTYIVTHPFRGPDTTKPASAANRADLGFAGRCVFGIDAPAATPGTTSFFGGDVVLDTAIVENADGYCAPGASIPFGPKIATAFPYQVLVDEAGEGSRIGMSNLGKATGNYQPSVDGWQRFNMGTSGAIRWTGYGFLHQGQRVRRTLMLNSEALFASGDDFDVQIHLLAKYTDPRGGATLADRLANRIPGTIAKPDKFLYRLPYAALDVSEVRIAATGNGLMPNDVNSSGTIAMHVVDWDARATESTAATWPEITAPDAVPVGTAGLPTVRLDVPYVLIAPLVLTLIDNDVAWGGDSAQDKGVPGDALAYTTTITNQRGGGASQVAGFYPGVVEVVDPEDALDRSGWELALHTDLTLLTQPGVRPITWQVLKVPVGDFGIAGCPDAPQSGTTLTVAPAFLASRDLNDDPDSFYVSYGPLDYGSFRTPTYSGVLFQAYHDGTGPSLTENYDLYSIAPATGAQTRLTDLGATFAHKQLSQIETDATNRIIFSQLDGATIFSDIDLVYAYAAPNIGYLDYSGSPITTAPKKINTGAARIVALTVDAHNTIWAVDHLNRLHQYVKIPSGYQETTAALLDLPTALNLATPFRVCDLALNFHNEAVYLLVKPDDGNSNVGRVYRLECDGTMRSSVNGNANPLLVAIYEYGGTLSIDNYAANGAMLTGQQDCQMLVGGFADPQDLYIVTGDLQISAQLFSTNGAMEFQPEYCGTRAMARLEVAGIDSMDAYTLPVGWQ